MPMFWAVLFGVVVQAADISDAANANTNAKDVYAPNGGIAEKLDQYANQKNAAMAMLTTASEARAAWDKPAAAGGKDPAGAVVSGVWNLGNKTKNLDALWGAQRQYTTADANEYAAEKVMKLSEYIKMSMPPGLDEAKVQKQVQKMKEHADYVGTTVNKISSEAQIQTDDAFAFHSAIRSKFPGRVNVVKQKVDADLAKEKTAVLQEQKDTFAALLAVDNVMPVWSKQANKFVDDEARLTNIETDESVKKMQENWDDKARELMSQNRDLSGFKRTTDNYRRETQRVVGKLNQKMAMEDSASMQKMKAITKGLESRGDKYTKKASKEIKVAGKFAKKGVKRFKSVTNKQMASTERNVENAEMEMTAMMNTVGQDTMKRQVAFKSSVTSSNTQIDKVAEQTSTMKEKWDTMKDSLNELEQSGREKLKEDVSNENELRQSTSKALYQEAKHSAGLAKDTLIQRGVLGAEQLGEGTSVMIATAKENNRESGDEFLHSTKRTESADKQVADNLGGLNEWADDKTKEVQAVEDTLPDKQGNAESALETRDREMSDSNFKAWEFLPDQLLHSKEKIAENLDNIFHEGNKTAEQLDYETRQVKNKLNAEALYTETMEDGLFDQSEQYDERLLNAFAANETTIAEGLDTIAERAAPAIISYVTETSGLLKTDYGDQKANMAKEGRKLSKDLAADLEGIDQAVLKKRDERVSKVEKDIKDLDTKIQDHKNTYSGELGVIKNDFAESSSELRSRYKELHSKTTGDAKAWGLAATSIGVSQGKLQASAEQIMGTSKENTQKNIEQVNGIRSSVEEDVNEKFDTLDQHLKEKKQEYIPVMESKLRQLREEASDSQKKESDNLAGVVEKTQNTLDKNKETLRRMRKMEGSLKSGSQTLLSNAFANVNGLLADGASNKVMAAANSAERKKVLEQKMKILSEHMASTFKEDDAELDADMQKAMSASKEKMKAILNDASLSDKEMQKKLDAEEKSMNRELTRLQSESKSAVKGIGKFLEASERANKQLANELSGATGEAGAEQTASQKAENEAKATATRELDKVATQTATVVDVIGNVENAVKHMLSSDKTSYQKKSTASAMHINDIGLKAKTAVDQIKTDVADMSARSEQATTDFRDGVDKMNRLMDASKEIAEGSIAQTMQGLREESKTLEDEGKRLNHEGTLGVSTVVTSIHKSAETLRPVLDNAQEQFESIQGDEIRREKQFAEIEALESGHAKWETRNLESSAHKLDFQQHDLERWHHGFKAKDYAWKQMVHDKLSELGVELDTTALEMSKEGVTAARDAAVSKVTIEGEVQSEMTSLERKTAAQIDAVFADADRRIAAIMSNENLTEAQKKEMVAQIQAESQAKRSKILAEQAAARQRQSELENGLDRYRAMVAAAKEATKNAVDQGLLHPSVHAVQENLAKVTESIHLIKQKPWLISSLELTDKAVKPIAAAVDGATSVSQDSNPRVLRRENNQLASANAKLAAHIDQVERELAALETKK